MPPQYMPHLFPFNLPPLMLQEELLQRAQYVYCPHSMYQYGCTRFSVFLQLLLISHQYLLHSAMEHALLQAVWEVSLQ